MVDIDTDQLRSNGYYSSCESDESTRSEFDEEYYRLRPPYVPSDYSHCKIVTIKRNQFAAEENKFGTLPVSICKSGVLVDRDCLNNQSQRNMVDDSNLIVNNTNQNGLKTKKRKRVRNRIRKKKSESDMNKCQKPNYESSSNIVISTRGNSEVNIERTRAKKANNFPSNATHKSHKSNDSSKEGYSNNTSYASSGKNKIVKKGNAIKLTGKNKIVKKDSTIKLTAKSTSYYSEDSLNRKMAKNANNFGTIPVSICKSGVLMDRDCLNNQSQWNMVDDSNLIVNNTNQNGLKTKKRKRVRNKIRKKKSESDMNKCQKPNYESSSNIVISTRGNSEVNIERTKAKKANNITSNTSHKSHKSNDSSKEGYSNNSSYASSGKNKIVKKDNAIKLTGKNKIVKNDSTIKLTAKSTSYYSEHSLNRKMAKNANNFGTIPVSICKSGVLMDRDCLNNQSQRNMVDDSNLIVNNTNQNGLKTKKRKRVRSRLKKYNMNKCQKPNYESSSNIVISTRGNSEVNIERTRAKKENNITSNTSHKSHKSNDSFREGYSNNSSYASSGKDKIVKNENTIKLTAKSAENAYTFNDNTFENPYNASSSFYYERDESTEDGYFYTNMEDELEYVPSYDVNMEVNIERTRAKKANNITSNTSHKSNDSFREGYSNNSSYASSGKDKIVKNENTIKLTTKSAENAYMSNDNTFENPYNASSSFYYERDEPTEDGYFYTNMENELEYVPSYDVNMEDNYFYDMNIENEWQYTFHSPVPWKKTTDSSRSIKFKNGFVQAIFEVIIFQLRPIQTIFQELWRNFFDAV